ncbi:hypothetical protein ABPG74_019875 [Tetrahymena malaccensis]
MADLNLLKKKKKKLDNNQQLRQMKYGCMLIQEINVQKVFQIAGDITIDVDQLLDKDNIKMISSWNQFIKVKQIKKQSNSQFVQMYLDTDVQMRSNLQATIEYLQKSQQKELYDLANLICEYQQVMKIKQHQENKSNSEQQTQQIIIKQEYQDEYSFNDCDELHGWNFQKSLEKAEKVLNELKDSFEKSDDFYSYILFKGNKYDQSRYMIGHSLQILRDFLCLNDEQIDYITLRNPLIFNLKYQQQYTEYLFNRVKNLIRLQKQEKGDLDYFRQGLNLVKEQTLDYYSIDNLSVQVQVNHYLYVLSNYKNQIDDVLQVIKWQPVRNQSASQVLRGLRNLKKQLNQKQEQDSQMNPFSNGQIYSDLNYQKNAEIFREKFYAIIDNDMYHEILENI